MLNGLKKAMLTLAVDGATTRNATAVPRESANLFLTGDATSFPVTWLPAKRFCSPVLHNGQTQDTAWHKDGSTNCVSRYGLSSYVCRLIARIAHHRSRLRWRPTHNPIPTRAPSLSPSTNSPFHPSRRLRQTIRHRLRFDFRLGRTIPISCREARARTFGSATMNHICPKSSPLSASDLLVW